MAPGADEDPRDDAGEATPSRIRANGAGLEILVVEDDAAVGRWLRTVFEREGHRVTVIDSAGDALRLAASARFDIVLLDVELGPGLDGYQICRTLRSSAISVPIIMLTGRSAEADAVRGLEAGADDYLTKPFGIAELNSRIRAVLRRTGGRGAPQPALSAGRLRLDLESRAVTFADRTVHLTFSEFQLLAALLERPGAVFSREALMAAIWGDSSFRDLRGIDVHVRHVREKLGRDVIATVRGGGYRVDPGASEPASSS
jgi:DNA-binding response OmpR family regulator